jgi:hypothetical protein
MSVDIFWAKVDMAGDCWLWMAYTNKKTGYGQYEYMGKMYRAHRFSWEQAFGAIPGGMCVLHRCDNPSCVNPSHLFLGTHLDNVHDRVVKGRSAKGEAHGLSKLTDGDVRQMRIEHSCGASYRALGRQYGVDRANVRSVVTGKTWSHVK